MKRFLLIVLICTGFSAYAQTYNNEWIDYTKTYYKFRVGADGLYRITQASLNTIGLGATPAEQFQLWRNGKEVILYTSVASGPLGGSDYIEFFGRMNDGKPDKELYRVADYQLADKWSLQTDTAAYFLTVNPAGGNLRFETRPNNVAGNVLPPEPYFMYTYSNYFKSQLNPGYAVSVGELLYSSSYDKGEGWTSGNIDSVNSLYTSINASVLQVATTAPENITLSFAASGNAIYQRKMAAYINRTPVDTTIAMNYFDYVRRSYTLPLSLIGKPEDTIQFRNIATSKFDRMVVSHFQLTYPRLFNFTGLQYLEFELPANASGNYLEISGFSASGVAPVVYDLTNQKRYVTQIAGSLIKVVLEPSAVTRKLVFAGQAAAQLKNVTEWEQRNFIDYAAPGNQGDFMIISNTVLFDDGAGNDPVEEYRAYRSSAPGGSYNAKVYLIKQLIDQFAFGIKQHPSSIRNFIRFARDRFSVPPAFVLLIGKGINYRSYRPSESVSNSTTKENLERLCLVPTFGHPASDNLLVSPPGSSQPDLPIGRLSVVYGYEVRDYLNKVKEYEQALKTNSCSIADEAWKKNVIHVVGGSDENLGTILDNYMSKYAGIISDSLFGAKVSLFSKNTADAVAQATSTQLANLINEGASIITYFGHSSSTTLEFNLDNPENYNNQGKYPLFIGLGCNAGNFFGFSTTRFYAKETLSEKFNLAPNRGTIVYVASSSFGIVHYLDLMNTKTYEAISRTKYGQPIGAIYDEAIRQLFIQLTQNDFYARFHAEQSIIHGDPAIRLNYHDKPDFVIEDPKVKIDPEFVSVAESNFNVNVQILNQGRVVNRDIVVTVKRKYPDQSEEVIARDTIPAPKYAVTLHYEPDIDPLRDLGTGSITITVDDGNNVDEYCETNNSVTKTFTVYEDEARPVYPYQYAIVNKQNIKLYASTANSFAPSRDYIMEIDTTEAFNSALKRSQTISSSGGVLEFDPGISFLDSTVYYWRVSPQSGNGIYLWNTSSFTYLPAAGEGFNQGHRDQFLENTNAGITIDSTGKEWKYTNRPVDFFIKSGVFPTSYSQATGFTVSVNNGEAYVQNACGISNVIFNVFDPVTLQPWFNAPAGSPGQYGSDAICGADRVYNFQFNILDTNKRRKIVEFLDLIPDGYFVVMRNVSGTNPASNTYAATWRGDTSYLGSGNSMYHRLKAQDFADIDSFYKPRAFGFVYRKNTPSFQPKSVFSQDVYDAISFSAVGETFGSKGTANSELFGPARAWKELRWRGHSKDTQPADDHFSVDVIGVSSSGIEDTLFANLTVAQQDLDISSVDPSTYPYIRLHFKSLDTTNLTPYQLEYWRLTYDPVPEGALAANQFLNLKDTLDLGEPLNFDIAFKNISSADFDSLKVSFTLTDNNNVTTVLPFNRTKPLVSGDTVHVSYQFDTEKLSGDNSLLLWVNPDYDQPEQYLFNNFGYKKFYVKPDSLDPLLDVTFDGAHILNRDIVSSKPRILVELKDEAKWMVLNDTSLVTLQVKYPDGSIRPFHFTNADTLVFNPAGPAPASVNKASIEFTPYFEQDGDYELIVSGHDRSNNKAGKIEYRVGFQVINKPMISNMLNYPNPFTTSTAFVFTITGSEVPQNIKIEIMTITGKIVREITKQELGPLHIGRNITEFKWDGTDQYGQKLANGIYLYRVVTNLNGKSLDKYKAEGDKTDKFFNKGYGKMYLMR